MDGTLKEESGRDDPASRALGPKRLMKISRAVIISTTIGIMLYGFLRFEFVKAPDGVYGPEFDAGDKVIVDKFPGHGRGLAAGDFVVFKPQKSREGGFTIGKILLAPEGAETAEGLEAALKGVFPEQSGEGIGTILELNAGRWPGPGHYLVGVTLPAKGGEGRLYLEWADRPSIRGRVLMRSPF